MWIVGLVEAGFGAGRGRGMTGDEEHRVAGRDGLQDNVGIVTLGK